MHVDSEVACRHDSRSVSSVSSVQSGVVSRFTGYHYAPRFQHPPADHTI
jgi:hypothetical protein